MRNIKVSIIIPVFNRGAVIGQTIRSVMEQSYNNWECIVVDDGSTDETVRVIKNFAKQDPRVILLSRPTNLKKGANSCRNFGFQHSCGQYIQWLDSDDVLHPNKLTTQIDNVDEENQKELYTSAWSLFSSQKDLNDIIIEQRKLYKNYIKVDDFIEDIGKYSFGFQPPHCYLMHRELVGAAGNWNENLSINQDGEFMCRIFSKSNRIIYCEGAIVYYRNDSSDLNRISQINSQQKAKDLIKSWKLIEETLNLSYDREFNYIDRAKSVLFERIGKQFPKLILVNLHFFRKSFRSLRNILIFIQRLMLDSRNQH